VSGVALPPAPPVSDGSLIPNVSPVQITSSKKVMPLTWNTLASGVRGRGRGSGRARGGGPISGHSCKRPHAVHIPAVNSVEGVANAVGISSPTPTSASRPVLAIVSPTRLPPCRGDSGSVRHSPMRAAKNIANAAIISGARVAAGIVNVGTPAFKRGKVELAGSVFKFAKTQHVEDVLDVLPRTQHVVPEHGLRRHTRSSVSGSTGYTQRSTRQGPSVLGPIQAKTESVWHRSPTGGNPWLTRSWTT
jgi:hypothetical protein